MRSSLQTSNLAQFFSASPDAVIMRVCAVIAQCVKLVITPTTTTSWRQVMLLMVTAKWLMGIPLLAKQSGRTLFRENLPVWKVFPFLDKREK